RNPVPFRLVMGFYFCVVLLSAVQAQVPFAVLFYAWQLLRIFLVYVLITKAVADERVVPALLTGMAIGICYEAGVVVWQRFALHVIQAPGTFIHQNLLGLMLHFVMLPLFALLLSGQPGWQTSITPLTGGIIATLTASRATVGVGGFGIVAIFLLSVL